MTSSKLPFGLKLAYGTGQISNGTMKTALGYFLLFYYNQVLGLSASLAGMAVGISFIIDAFTDPLMGSLSDHWRSRLGRRHPFMYASILPVAICFYFLFNPLVSTETGLFVWLMIFANATRTAVSIFNIPHMALGAEITDDFDDRSSIVGFRVFFENLGFFIVLGAGFGIFFVSTPEFENGQLNEAAYPPFALLMSAVMSVAIFWAAWGTRSVIPRLPGVPDARPRFHRHGFFAS
jgi:Na+/melibiose symporter-like transporter